MNVLQTKSSVEAIRSESKELLQGSLLQQPEETNAWIYYLFKGQIKKNDSIKNRK